MDNLFEIPVTYDAVEYAFSATLITYGFSYKIEVDVLDRMITFEPDEERNFRAVANYNEIQDWNTIDKKIIEAIAIQLNILFKD
jgi:hypothetical protein